MTPLGSPNDWAGLLESQVPDILTLVIETWEAMPAPAANALEDPVSEALCRSLRQSRNRCDLPFRIDTQLVELDPAAGQEQGRMDIVFSPTVPRENIYFCLECKRINVRHADGVRAYFVEYVRFGMLRFVRGLYANSVRHGGMLAFVLGGDVPGAIAGVEGNVGTLHQQLGMAPPGEFLRSSVRPDDERVRETRHQRGSHPSPFVLHHLFLAGDPNAPMLPEPPKDSASSAGKKQRTTTRRKRPGSKGAGPG
jgi:hypothetical protein